MIYFKELTDSIDFAIKIQKDLMKDKLKVNKHNFEIRIGICYGELIEKNMNFQGKELKDYFGNVTNSSSQL